MKRRMEIALLGIASACANDSMSRSAPYELGDMAPVYCDGLYCQPGFHCEFDACIADEQPRPPTAEGDAADPLASGRYVFTLERGARRIVRIDSLSLEVTTLTAGLAPMAMGVVGSRELTVLLDALDVVEILDHRATPPTNAAWTTARALSHLALSPSGEHAIAYYDWDDPRAQSRQSEPGNINQVTVLFIADGATPFADSDARAQNVAVGFLPLEVRFAEDGGRAVVISRGGITPILLGGIDDIAAPEPTVPVRENAAEIVIDAGATTAALRFAGSAEIDVVSLDGTPRRCFVATAPVTDIALAGELLLADVGGAQLAVTPLSAATSSCTALDESIAVGGSRLVVHAGAARVIAFEPSLSAETIWSVDLESRSVSAIPLEKAVASVAFAGDGRHALLAHLKAPGEPLWDLSREDPEISVDKSYGVSWIDLTTGAHRLAVSDSPFGAFTFVPPDPRQPDSVSVTYQALLDPERPVLLRVAHQPGFDDRWIDLAAAPLQLGYLGASARAYVTQDHPWGRVTFVDLAGTELRHVTGFAMEMNQ